RPAAPVAPHLPAASTWVGTGPNETELTCTAAPFWPAGEAAIAAGVESVRQLPPASELASTVPLSSTVASWRPETASAAGEAATPLLIGPSGDPLGPAAAGAATGVKRRPWRGRPATVTPPPPSAAATSPPLSATPGGVTS